MRASVDSSQVFLDYCGNEMMGEGQIQGAVFLWTQELRDLDKGRKLVS